MGETLSKVVFTVIVIVGISVITIIVTANNALKVHQANIEELTVEFGNKIAQTGECTREDYEQFKVDLNTQGDAMYSVSVVIGVLDTTKSQKPGITSSSVVGVNEYFNLYTNDLEEYFAKPENTVYKLKPGDTWKTVVENESLPTAQEIENSLIGLFGGEPGKIGTEYSVVILENGRVK